MKKLVCILILATLNVSDLYCQTSGGVIIRAKYGYEQYYLVYMAGMENYDNVKTQGRFANFLLFAGTMSEEKISNITVNQLKNLSYATYGEGLKDSLFYLGYIYGFESYTEELKKMDEFEIAAKKDYFIDKLQECYKSYKNEYDNKYLNGEFETQFGRKVKNDESLYSGLELYSMSFTKEDYNFDKQTMFIANPLVGESGFYSFYWTQIYTNNLFEQYGEVIKKSDNYSVPLGEAKYFFLEGMNTVRIKGKLLPGFMKRYGHGANSYLSNMRIDNVMLEIYDLPIINGKQEYKVLKTLNLYSK